MQAIRPSRPTMAAPVVTCTCRTCSKARVTLERIFNVLDTYGWLLDSYVVVRNSVMIALASHSILERFLNCISPFQPNCIHVLMCQYTYLIHISRIFRLSSFTLFFENSMLTSKSDESHCRISSKSNCGRDCRRAGGPLCKPCRPTNSESG